MNANQNHNEILLHTHYFDGYNQKDIETVNKDVETQKPPDTAGEIVNSAGLLKNSLVAPQLLKHRVTIRSSNTMPNYIAKRTENR